MRSGFRPSLSVRRELRRRGELPVVLFVRCVFGLEVSAIVPQHAWLYLLNVVLTPVLVLVLVLVLMLGLGLMLVLPFFPPCFTTTTLYVGIYFLFSVPVMLSAACCVVFVWHGTAYGTRNISQCEGAVARDFSMYSKH